MNRDKRKRRDDEDYQTSPVPTYTPDYSTPDPSPSPDHSGGSDFGGGGGDFGGGGSDGSW